MGTYDSVEDIDKQFNQEKQEQILHILKENKGTPITANKMGKQVGLSTSQTAVKVRHAIRCLIENNHPIVAINTGFMYAVHPNQVERYIESLRERQQGIENRIESLKEAKTNCTFNDEKI